MSAEPPDPVGRMPAGAGAERSFPLIAMFHLATFWAAMVACIDGPQLSTSFREAHAAKIAATAIIGGLLGAGIGFGQLRMGRSVALGALVGVLYGPTILAVYAAPAPMERGLAAAALLIITTVALRIRSA